MLFAPNTSYEIDIFTKWFSGVRYDLSVNWLKRITKEELLDLLSNDIFAFEKNDIIDLTKEKLLSKLNIKLMQFYSPEYFELFGITDPRETELTQNEKNIYSTKNFPKHVLTLLTHGTYFIPSEVREHIKNDIYNIVEWEKLTYKNYLRIIKNFSDFWTRYVVKKSFIPKTQVLSNMYSRFVWDPARDIEADDFIRNTDWSKNILLWIKNDNKKYWKAAHRIYHNSIEKRLLDLEKENWWSITIDDHDTWVLQIWVKKELDKFQSWWFPFIVLSTWDWDSCNNEILSYYAERIEFHLWIKVLINNPYKWGYVLKKHWTYFRNTLLKYGWNYKKRNLIQQEVWKFLYLNERTQKVDFDKAELIWIWLARAKADLWRKFWKKYFSAIKKWDEAVNKYLENYK